MSLQVGFKLPKNSLLTDKTTTNMPTAIQNTVDRLDKPSAYYQSRVSQSNLASLLYLKYARLTRTLYIRTRSASMIETVMIGMAERRHPRSYRRTR